MIRTDHNFNVIERKTSLQCQTRWKKLKNGFASGSLKVAFMWLLMVSYQKRSFISRARHLGYWLVIKVLGFKFRNGSDFLQPSLIIILKLLLCSIVRFIRLGHDKLRLQINILSEFLQERLITYRLRRGPQTRKMKLAPILTPRIRCGVRLLWDHGNLLPSRQRLIFSATLVLVDGCVWQVRSILSEHQVFKFIWISGFNT